MYTETVDVLAPTSASCPAHGTPLVQTRVWPEPEPDFERNVYENALSAITTAGGGGAFAEEYRAAGGGYEGLQAIAEKALAVVRETGR